MRNFSGLFVLVSIPGVRACQDAFASVLTQIEEVSASIEHHFPPSESPNGVILIASNALRDTEVILMTLAQGAVTFPFCFSTETRLEILQRVAVFRALAADVFRAYFHAFQLSRVWFYGYEPRNQVRVMQIAADLHAQLAVLHGVVAAAMAASPSSAEFGPLSDHTATGTFVGTEVLLRQSFPEIPRALTDVGLLRALLRHVFPVDATGADLGALDGQYSRWLNETGLVQAFAFDGIVDVDILTAGVVQPFDLTDATAGPVDREFDFVLCLEVAEHIPKEFEHVFLSHLSRLSRRVILSWSATPDDGVAHVNAKTQDQVEATLREYGFELNVPLTSLLRNAATIPWIKTGVSFYEQGAL